MVGLRYYRGGAPPSIDGPHNQAGGWRGPSSSNTSFDAFGIRLHGIPMAIADQLGKLSNSHDPTPKTGADTKTAHASASDMLTRCL